MKIKVTLAMLIIAVCFSCSKEEIDTKSINELKINNGIPTFSTSEEFMSTIGKTINMTSDELSEYENSMNYKSFGSKCEEIYFSINFDELSSLEEFKTLVNENSKYLQLVKNEENKYELEHHLFKSPERYTINENRMFQIGDTVYKSFNTHFAYTNVKNVETLLKIEEDDLAKNDTNQGISIIERNVNITTKDVTKSGGAGERTDPYDLGRERMRITIGCHQPGYLQGETVPIARGYYIARPYKRNLGV